MPSLAEYLNKPEYVFRPSQVMRRLGRAFRRSSGEPVVLLPWGLPLRIRTSDDIGRALWTTGVYDLAVSEVLWRLLEPGETAADAGANIGYVTSLMAARNGSAGAVRAYEPHPAVFAELAANHALWMRSAIATVELREAGLSDRARAARLVEGAAFAKNRGMARVGDDAEQGLAVRLTTLDQEFPPGARIGVLKIDVEGHEAAVLGGAGRLLAARAIRDVVYEEHTPGAGAATAVLRSRGYTVFGITKALLGPALGEPGSGGSAWTPASCLATLEPERARARLAPRGWECLRGH